MADTVCDFTRPAMSALLAGYRSISAYYIKGPFHPKIRHFSCICILMLFTAVQQQPYRCAAVNNIVMSEQGIRIIKQEKKNRRKLSSSSNCPITPDNENRTQCPPLKHCYPV